MQTFSSKFSRIPIDAWKEISTFSCNISRSLIWLWKEIPTFFRNISKLLILFWKEIPIFPVTFPDYWFYAWKEIPTFSSNISRLLIWRFISISFSCDVSKSVDNCWLCVKVLFNVDFNLSLSFSKLCRSCNINILIVQPNLL